MQKVLKVFAFCTTLIGCASPEGNDRLDEGQYVSEVFKLPSTDDRIALYSYWIKYPNAHYGHARFSVLSQTEKFSPKSKYFSFEDTLYGYNIIGWSGDTIKSICVTPSQTPPQILAPYNVEVTKFQDVYRELNYYYANSFGGTTERFFDSVSYFNDKIVFSGKDTSLGEIEKFQISASKGQVRVPLGDSIVRVVRLESLTQIDPKYNNGDSTRRPPLVSLASYILRPKSKFDWIRLKQFGVFTEQLFSP